MKLDTQDKLVIDDAARLAKSTFLNLYTKLGYDEQEASNAWHGIRVTSTGRKIMFQYGVGQPSKSYDIDQEVKRRKEDMKSKHIKPVNVPKSVEKVADEIEATIDEGPILNTGDADSQSSASSKEEIAKNIITSGVTKAKDLATQGKFSVPYAYLMLKKYGPGKKS